MNLTSQQADINIETISNHQDTRAQSLKGSLCVLAPR